MTPATTSALTPEAASAVTPMPEMTRCALRRLRSIPDHLLGQLLGPLMVALAFACLTVLTPDALAQTQVFTSDTTISDTDLSYEGFDIVVRGATVTIDGMHAFNSLTVERDERNAPGVVTHSPAFSNRDVNGLWLTIAQSLLIEGAEGPLVASRIDLVGRGFAGGTGPGAGTSEIRGGGAGHGGLGAPGDLGQPGGLAYGSFAMPTALGSGGGNDTGGGTPPGGAGGGALRVLVEGLLSLDGLIVADGAGGVGGQAGGGSGGSVWIIADSLIGSGTISAIGGAGSENDAIVGHGGGGSGGRISIQSNSMTLPTDHLQAFGGLSGDKGGPLRGAAGTVWIVAGDDPGRLIVAGEGGTPATTPFAGTLSVPMLDVLGGARVGPLVGDDSLEIVVAGDVFIDESSSLHAAGAGHPGGTGPGAGASSIAGGGAGHGGSGAPFSLAEGGGVAYGSFAMPTEMGSGGGNDLSIFVVSGGSGGGVLNVTVGGTLIVEGSIDARGLDGIAEEAGGGSGGSVRIVAASVAGSGTITVDGGAAGGDETIHGGGGAGGRIAIETPSLTLPVAQVRASGGASGSGTESLHGAAGTIVIVEGAGAGRLIIAGAGAAAVTTPFSGTVAVSAFEVLGGARVGPLFGDDSLEFVVSGDMHVDGLSSISAKGAGHAGGTGPGAGASAPVPSGAGHGGTGASSSDGAAGGITYGSFAMPIEMGSGGGNSTAPFGLPGGPGGGVLRLSIAGALLLEGTMDASGLSGPASSGGSGGSVWISAATISGSGTIIANGGDGSGTAQSYAGGGAGGRIAIDSCAIDLPQGSILALGGQSGLSANDAEPGTIAFFSGTIGDLNDDCLVDGADLGILLGAWGSCVDCAADLNHDGVVNGADLGILLGAWENRDNHLFQAASPHLRHAHRCDGLKQVVVPIFLFLVG